MIDKIESLSEYLTKIPLTFLVAILSFLSITLFLPLPFAEKLAIVWFQDTFRVILGPSFLLVLSFFIARLFTHLKEWWLNRYILKQRQKLLHNLTPDEKSYLAPYIFEQETTQNFGIDDGVKGNLESKSIIYQASTIGNMMSG